MDYRRGCAPISGNDKYIVYPHGRLDLRGAPAFYEMQDTVVVRKANGEPWWTMRVGDLFGEPILSGEHVFAPTDDGILHALHLSGPQRVAWTYDAGSPLRTTPVSDDTSVYVGAQDGTLHAIVRSNGTVRWKLKVNHGEPRAHQLFSPPYLHDGKLYLGSATGKEQWKHSLLQCTYENGRRILADVVAAGGDYQSPPTVSKVKVFIVGPDRFVRAMDTQSGKEIWRFVTGGGHSMERGSVRTDRA